MLFKRDQQSRGRQNKIRKRVLRVESLDRREVMDAYGLQFDLPSDSAYHSTFKSDSSAEVAHGARSSSSLVYGSVRSDSISRPGEIDRFTVQAAAGQKFQLALSPTAPFGARMRVTDSGGRVAFDSSTSSVFAPVFTSSRTGAYQVEVMAQNGRSTGSYRLGLESLSRPSNDAIAMSTGSVQAGRLSGTVQIDQYTVTAAANQRFQVGLATEAGLNATVRVFRPGGDMLVNSATNSAIAPQFTASTAGTYIVQVQATNLTSLGRYRVGIESLSQPSADAKPIEIGSVASGALTGTVQVDQFRFTATPNQRFQVAVASMSGMNTVMRVYAPGGELLVNTASTTATRNEFRAASGGTYVIQIQAANLTSLGQYRVGIESLSTPSPDVRNLTVGPTVERSLQQAVQADQFRISARAGQRYRIDLVPFSGMHTRIRVMDESGRLLVNSSTTTGRGYEFTANTTGNLIVMIEGFRGTEIGRYSIRLSLR